MWTQMSGQFFLVDQLEHQSLTAADDGRWHFVFFGSGQNEHHHRWWLFDCLEERIERFFREHVAFVDNVKLVSSALCHKRSALDQ